MEVDGSFSAALLKDYWGRETHIDSWCFLSGQRCLAFMVNYDGACTWRGRRSHHSTHTPGDLASHSLDVGPFDDLSNMQQEEETKWTLVVNGVDRFHPSLSNWMDRIFAFVPRCSAKQGCGLDLAITFLYDVFLIQTSGKREWQVGVNKVSARDEVDSAVPEIPVRIL